MVLKPRYGRYGRRSRSARKTSDDDVTFVRLCWSRLQQNEELLERLQQELKRMRSLLAPLLRRGVPSSEAQRELDDEGPS